MPVISAQEAFVLGVQPGSLLSAAFWNEEQADAAKKKGDTKAELRMREQAKRLHEVADALLDGAE